MLLFAGRAVACKNFKKRTFQLDLMTSRQSKLQEDTYFRVMGILHDNPNKTQRELADMIGLSLGGLNYCLRSLIDKGFVKMQNFNNSKNKIKFVYLLTPKGIKEKSVLTFRFLERKLKEYDALKAEIEVVKGQFDLSGNSKLKILHLD